MYLNKIYSLLIVLQATASAVTWNPTCNADNCLRGLFGVNARSTAANLAACSTGLPTVTVLVDGSARTTITATIAPPPVASVCDGQGVDKRAARFKSACSCIGILPSTVTQNVAPPQVSLGQVATANDVTQCFDNFDILQGSRTSAGQSYEVPRAGLITSATHYDGFAGTVAMEIWRPVSVSEYTLVGKSDLLPVTGSGAVVSFVLPQPIAVQAGDILGLFEDYGACYIQSTGDIARYRYGAISDVGQTQSFTDDVGYLVNVAAVLQ